MTAHSAQSKTVLIIENVRTLRHDEFEAIGGNYWIFLEILEGQQRYLTEGVAQLHCLRHAVAQADADVLESAVLGFGRGIQP